MSPPQLEEGIETAGFFRFLTEFLSSFGARPRHRLAREVSPKITMVGD
jgi:hypothetical protein